MRYVAVFGLFLILIVAACTPAAPQEVQEEEIQEPVVEVVEEPEPIEEVIEEPVEEVAEEPEEVVEETAQVPEWHTTELTDVLTEETFTIADFSGETVVLESFAVWCPTCLRQQKEMAKVEGVVHIALGTDPNEGADRIKEHAENNGFDWRFAVSPPDFTQTLIDEFGVAIVAAPSAPVVIVCPTGESHFLDRGFKSANSIVESIGEHCGA